MQNRRELEKSLIILVIWSGLMFVTRILLIFCLCSMFVARAQTGPPAERSSAVDISIPDVAAIVQIAKDFSAAFNAGDAKTVMSFYSPDVIYSTQAGEANFQDVTKQRAAFLSAYKMDLAVHVIEVRVSGDMAFDRATYTLTAVPKAGGETLNLSGRLLEVLRKENGKWKSLRIMGLNDKVPQ